MSSLCDVTTSRDVSKGKGGESSRPAGDPDIAGYGL